MRSREPGNTFVPKISARRLNRGSVSSGALKKMDKSSPVDNNVEVTYSAVLTLLLARGLIDGAVGASDSSK
jgi:hypothetical protein